MRTSGGARDGEVVGGSLVSAFCLRSSDAVGAASQGQEMRSRSRYVGNRERGQEVWGIGSGCIIGSLCSGGDEAARPLDWEADIFRPLNANLH